MACFNLRVFWEGSQFLMKRDFSPSIQRTRLGGAWAATGVSCRFGCQCISTVQREDLHILLLSVHGWQLQCSVLSTMTSGIIFFYCTCLTLFFKALEHLSWIPLSTKIAALLVSSIKLYHPEKLDPSFLQSSLGLDIQRNTENPRSQVTQYFVESVRVVPKSLDRLVPQVYCING